MENKVKAAALRWLAKQLQPYLEPTTTLSNVTVINKGNATAIQVEPGNGYRIAPGTRIEGK